MADKQPRIVTVQHRAWDARYQVRAAREDGSIPVEGYAAVFESYSDPLWDWWTGEFVEIISRGAFARAIVEDDVVFAPHHDATLLLARSRPGGGESNTLRLSEDEHGLHVDADMAPTTIGRDLAISMARGDITQTSFKFRPDDMREDGMRGGLPVIRLDAVRLYDVAPVVQPAYPATEIALGERARAVRDTLFRAGVGPIVGALPREQRAALLAGLAGDAPRADEAATLRGAAATLTALADGLAPAARHSGRPVDYLRRRLDLLAKTL